MSRRFAQPLHIRLPPEGHRSRRFGQVGSVLLTLGILGYALLHATPQGVLITVLVVALAGLWQGLRHRRSRKAPRWTWLICDAQGQWWLAAEVGGIPLPPERVQCLPDSRVEEHLVVLLVRHAASGKHYEFWWTGRDLEAPVFRHLRVRLRWPDAAMAVRQLPAPDAARSRAGRISRWLRGKPVHVADDAASADGQSPPR